MDNKLKSPTELLDMLNRLSPDTIIKDKKEIIDYIDGLHNIIMSYKSHIDHISWGIEQHNKHITR